MVDIRKVYDRVLFIINKENRGYITPVEFDSLAEQAQLEIYQSYFAKEAAATAAGASNNMPYSSPTDNLSEQIHFFSETVTLPDTDQDGFFIYPDNFYRLGVIRVLRPGGLPVIADEVSHMDITYINLSNLTAPTINQPVFTRRTRLINGVAREGVETYPMPNYQPGQVNYDIEMDYLRKPVTPSLGTATIVNSEVTYSSDAIDFELHPSEEIELVSKILSMSGVITNNGEVTGYAQGKEQQIQASE